MRAHDLKPIFEKLISAFPCFYYRKNLLFYRPVGTILRGMHFDPSAFSKDAFRVTALLMPFFIPEDDYHMTCGHEIRTPGEGWSMTMDDLVPKLVRAIDMQALPFLDSVRNEADFAKVAVRFIGNEHAANAIAFALVRTCQYEQAIDLINAFTPRLLLEEGWPKALAEQALLIRDMIIANPTQAQRQLAEWETYTIGKLGLEAYR